MGFWEDTLNSTKFWEDTLSSTIGSFIGVAGAVVVAIWQVKKTQKLNNIPFYINFNQAQIYINQFNEKVDEILEITSGENRGHARVLLNGQDYLELKLSIERAIKAINKDIKEVDFSDFAEELGKFNQHAPIAYYTDLNFIFFGMALIYNLLLDDSKYLVRNLPSKIAIPGYGLFYRDFSFRLTLKNFRKKYKKMKKKLNIR